MTMNFSQGSFQNGNMRSLESPGPGHFCMYDNLDSSWSTEALTAPSLSFNPFDHKLRLPHIVIKRIEREVKRDFPPPTPGEVRGLKAHGCMTLPLLEELWYPTIGKHNSKDVRQEVLCAKSSESQAFSPRQEKVIAVAENRPPSHRVTLGTSLPSLVSVFPPVQWKH